MAWSSLKPGAAIVLHLRRRAPPTAAAPAELLRRHMATSTTQPQPHGGEGDGNRGSGGGVVKNPPPGMAPLPEDAPPQTPPRLGEPDPFGPPVPPTSKDKLGGGGKAEGGAGAGAPGAMSDTAPPPDVEVPPVSPDGRNV